MPHYDFGTGRYDSNARVIRPSIRSHAAVWHKYQKHIGRCPVLSVLIYGLRYVLVPAGAIFCVWYSETRRWTKVSTAAAVLTSLVLMFGWLKFEILVWNLELRKRNLSSATDVWDVTQFPSNRC